MSRIGPAIIGLLLAALLAFGLFNVLNKNLKVAPWAKEAAEGRLHFHTKNTTRVGGTPEQVAQTIARAVALSDDVAPDIPLDWRDRVRAKTRAVGESRHVVILPGEGEQAAAYALPGAYWAVYAGAAVLFAGPNGVAEQDLPQLQPAVADAPAAPVIYVLAPKKLIPDRVLDQLGPERRVVRVADDDLFQHAVRIATYRDPGTAFGWGRTHARRNGYFHYVLTTPAEAEHAIEAMPLAASNAATLLFATDDGGLPAATDRYLWHTRSEWFVTPAEGPFHHLWLIGNRISYAAQGRLDLAIEKAPYASLGPAALGPIEALAVVLIALGLACGIFVWLHAWRTLPEVSLAIRLAWTFTSVLVPIGGMLLYFAAYRRPSMRHDGMLHWQRPPAIEAAAATAMGFGYGAPLMIAIGYAFVYFGFPLFYGPWADGWQFVFGAGMPLMMVGMYVGAILIAWPLVQFPMRRMMTEASAARVLWTALGVTALSMAAVSLGMMTVSWWMMMSKLPMMPKEDDILWFGAMWLASLIGFLVAWPLNWPMVRVGLKPGGM